MEPHSTVAVGLDGEPISFFEGAALMEDIDARRVGLHVVHNRHGDGWSASTAHMTINHRFSCPGGPPLAWETRIEHHAANGRGWELTKRYDNRHMAREAHACLVPLLHEFLHDREWFERRWKVRMTAHGVRGNTARPDGTVVSLGGVKTPYIYSLDGTPTDLKTGAKLYEDYQRRLVASDDVALPDGAVELVTVFHVFDDDAAVCAPDPEGPFLWSTAAKTAGSYFKQIARYRNAPEAEAGHADLVTRLRDGDLTSLPWALREHAKSSN